MQLLQLHGLNAHSNSLYVARSTGEMASARYHAAMLQLVVVVVVGMNTLLQTVRAQNAEFLSAHNNERRSLGVRGLVWDARVAAYARQYGEKQRDQANCALKHSGGPYGENLFWTSAASVRPGEAVKAWIDEKRDYNYQLNRCRTGRVCGHYTQVVWANSLRLGCAAIACHNNRGTFVICNYDPPGNWAGQRPYSPLPPLLDTA